MVSPFVLPAACANPAPLRTNTFTPVGVTSAACAEVAVEPPLSKINCAGWLVCARYTEPAPAAPGPPRAWIALAEALNAARSPYAATRPPPPPPVLHALAAPPLAWIVPLPSTVAAAIQMLPPDPPPG